MKYFCGFDTVDTTKIKGSGPYFFIIFLLFYTHYARVWSDLLFVSFQNSSLLVPGKSLSATCKMLLPISSFIWSCLSLRSAIKWPWWPPGWVTKWCWLVVVLFCDVYFLRFYKVGPRFSQGLAWTPQNQIGLQTSTCQKRLEVQVILSHKDSNLRTIYPWKCGLKL